MQLSRCPTGLNSGHYRFLTSPNHHKPLSLLASCECNTLNLHGHALGQLIDRNAAPRRLMRKELLIDLIHLDEVIHRRQKHIDLDDLAER